MSYLRYLCLFVHNDIQHMLCCFCFIFFVYVAIFFWIVFFFISPSVFSNVY
jgi:apolipoprotein N-acyltransferase